MLVVVLCIQGWLCAVIAFDLVRDEMDKGMAGMIAGFVLARGGGVGFVVGVIFYLLMCDNDKIRDDYAYNKEQQRIEDEETNKQLEALAARLEAIKAGKVPEEK